MHTAASYLPRKHGHFQDGLHWGYLSQYLFRYLRLLVNINVISELRSLERQSNISVCLQKEIFCVKSNTHRRLFTWRHLKAGQYVTQSGLNLHQCEPHSCEQKKRTVVRNFEMLLDLLYN